MSAFTPLPQAGWRLSPPMDDDVEDVFSRRQQARLERMRYERALLEILGPCLVGTTMLTRAPRPMLGPAYDRHGHVLRWSLWSPVKGVLIDIFRRRVPASGELEDRRAFAAAHELQYGVVEPGQHLSLARLREWVEHGAR